MKIGIDDFDIKQCSKFLEPDIDLELFMDINSGASFIDLFGMKNKKDINEKNDSKKVG